MRRFFNLLLYISLLILPTQFGKHFWPDFALVLGRRIDYLSPTIYFVDLFIIVALLLGWKIANGKQKKVLIKLSLGVLFISLVSLWVSSFKWSSLYLSWQLLRAVTFGWLIWISGLSLVQLILPLALSTCLISLLAISQFIAQRSLGSLFYFLGERQFDAQTPGIAQILVNGRLLLRPYATLPHPNVLAGFLATLLPLFLFHFSAMKNKIYYVVKLVTVGLLYIALFLSFSRIAWVAATMTTLAYLFHTIKNKSKLQLVGLTLISIVVIEEIVLGRFTSLVTTDIDSIQERQKLVQAAWAMFTFSPWVGQGWGSFLHLLPLYSKPPYLIQPVHSIYLLTLVETGILGLVIFVAVGVASIRKAFKTRMSGLVLAIASLLFLGLFDHYLFTVVQGQLLLALICSLSLV